MITVYTISGAPPPWRVLLGRCFKGLPFETITLKASEGEHQTKEFLSLNPRGTVPVLVDGSVTIRDSLAALAWLDCSYPDPPIFGKISDQTAFVWQQTTECADYLRAAIDRVLTPIFFQNATSASPELLTSAYNAKVELAGLETALGTRSFLSGDSPSAADAVAFPEVRLLQRASDTRAEIIENLGLLNF
ncbi:glutathione S-transferase family protein [Planktotalea sp.]|uniref:glutathione S-transferase family protein n=1 Tax=Planktotalea sp. TaxID=2029877 RepID=UPI00329724D1